MAELIVPEILNIPPKLIPIITDLGKYRYFLIEGGRSSGKTQAIARFLLWCAEQKQLRIVCGREFQNSIEESVYTVFADLIRSFNLYFDVLASKIDHKKTQSSIRFRGFREQGSSNIKGLEGVDILWVDESQAVTKQTLDVIIPTIRKNNSKIIWTMNRHVENDPVYTMFASREDCLCIHLDYIDNPFCPDAMKLEAEACRKRNIQDYEHIWLGKPLLKGSDYLFSLDVVKKSLDQVYINNGQRNRVMAVDVARFGGDEIVYCVLERKGFTRWEMIHQETDKDKSLMETTGKIIDMVRQFELDRVIVDDTGLGGGVTDRLNELKVEVIPFNGGEKSNNPVCENKRADAYFKLKEWFEHQFIKPLNDGVLLDQLCTIRYKYKSDGKRIIMSKDEMRREGLTSPDRADALMMAVYYCDAQFNNGFDERHSSQNTSRPQYAICD